jgi:hypothetical protein
MFNEILTLDFWTMAGMFAGLQVINVILNSLKTLIMAKTDSPHQSALINAVTFGFFALIVNQIAALPLEITVPVTIIANVIGVYVTYAIFKKIKKDTLWKIELWIPNPEAYAATVNICKLNGIPVRKDTENFLTVFSSAQAQSQIIKNTLAEFADTPTKYNITEVTKKL